MNVIVAFALLLIGFLVATILTILWHKGCDEAIKEIKVNQEQIISSLQDLELID